VWTCVCGHEECAGSFTELQSKPGVKGIDAFDVAKKADPTLNDHLRVHKPWIDSATFACPKCGKEMKRTPEVIDCWYDSGAMPFAQWGYPHAPGSKEQFNLAFPADFISEAIDQTRGWFYTLMMEGTLLKDSFAKTSDCKRHNPLPYKTCLVLGHVCDEKGEKMSKSKGNYLDPNLILDEEGADALRWFFYSSTNPWTSARFSRPAVREAQKEFLIKLRNVYSFFVIYANIDGFDPTAMDDLMPLNYVTQLDKWIISELNITTSVVSECLDRYDIFGAAQVLNGFVESLSNWYVRRSRDRFWSSWESFGHSGSDHDDAKLSAYGTLYDCLVVVAQLAAPFVPFMAEEIYQNLVANLFKNEPQSVHLCDYPTSEINLIDRELATEIALVREIASLGRAARSASKLKTRQPLGKVVVVLADAALDEIVRKHEQVLLDELNVKAIEIAHRADQYVSFELKPNFKAIGAKHRELVPGIKAALAKANAAEMRAQMESSGKAKLMLEDKEVELSPEDVEVTLKAKEGYAAASGRSIVVVLDTHLTQDLLDEGVARELVNRVNGWRRDLNLAYEQRIKLAFKGSAKLEAVAAKFKDYINRETLSTELLVGEIPEGYQRLDIEIDAETGAAGLLTA